MKSKNYFFFAIILLAVIMNALQSCIGSKNTLVKETVISEVPSTVSYLAGVNSGGVVENNTLEGIDGIAGVDAITGATRTRFNAGIHKEIQFKGFTFETGLDYLVFDQTITYDLPSCSLDGQRHVRFSQLRLPLTYNFQFFRRGGGAARLNVKVGFSLGYTISKSVSDAGTVPGYTFKNRDYGPTLGVSFYPFPPLMNYRIGFYMDLFRGSRIYKDSYHTAEGMGGQSYMKFGIVLQ